MFVKCFGCLIIASFIMMIDDWGICVSQITLLDATICLWFGLVVP